MVRHRIDEIILILSQENIAEVFNIENLIEIKIDRRSYCSLQKINYFLEWFEKFSYISLFILQRRYKNKSCCIIVFL